MLEVDKFKVEKPDSDKSLCTASSHNERQWSQRAWCERVRDQKHSYSLLRKSVNLFMRAAPPWYGQFLKVLTLLW